MNRASSCYGCLNSAVAFALHISLYGKRFVLTWKEVPLSTNKSRKLGEEGKLWCFSPKYGAYGSAFNHSSGWLCPSAATAFPEGAVWFQLVWLVFWAQWNCSTTPLLSLHVVRKSILGHSRKSSCLFVCFHFFLITSLKSFLKLSREDCVFPIFLYFPVFIYFLIL